MCVCLQATACAENSWSHGCCHQDWGTMGWPSKPLRASGILLLPPQSFPGQAEQRCPLAMWVCLSLPLIPLCHQHEASQDSEILLCKGKNSFILNFRAQPKFLTGFCDNFIFKAGHKNSPEFFFLLFSLPAISKNQQMLVYFCALHIEWHIP